MPSIKTLFPGLTILLLAACASSPKFETAELEDTVTPQAAVGQIDDYRGKTALWGGVIVNAKNQENSTLLEILAYPLDRYNHKPDTSESQQGRFLATYQGYLETADYAQGRLITVLGAVDGKNAGKIGEADYTYPAVTIRQHHLWPTSEQKSTEPRFHFGIGVILSN